MKIQITQKQIRYTLAIIISIFFVINGVYIFSNFRYQGLTLKNDIFPIMFEGNFNSFWSGFFQLISSGLKANIFSLFSKNQLAESSFFGIVLGNIMWPVICAWFTTGFISGIILKSPKKGTIFSLIIYAATIVLWIKTEH